MKKVVLLMLLFAGFSITAQEGRDKQRRGGMDDLSAEQMATLQTKQMTLALDLNEKQQGEIQKVNLKQATERKAKMEARKSKKEATENAKPSSEERYAMHNEKLDNDIARKADIKKILTQEQYTKWDKMDHKRGVHRDGRKGHGKEGHRKSKEEGKQ